MSTSALFLAPPAKQFAGGASLADRVDRPIEDSKGLIVAAEFCS